MKDVLTNLQRSNNLGLQNWFWWPLFPLYPYGSRNTIFSELVPNLVWGFEQLQGLYYVAVPIRLIVLKVSGGLMLGNPLPPTDEILRELDLLQKKNHLQILNCLDQYLLLLKYP